MKQNNFFKWVSIFVGLVIVLFFSTEAIAIVLRIPDARIKDLPVQPEIEFRITESQMSKPEFEVSVQDLERAGFKNVVQLTPLQTRFVGPMQYFRVFVTSSVSTTLYDCDDCASLISVYSTPIIATGTPKWALQNNPTIEYVHGRSRLQLFVAGRILFITAPDDPALQTFMQAMRERIVLNKN